MARAATSDPLKRYTQKRDFRLTPEPKPVRAGEGASRSFVVQKHWASRLHYDFRLELDGVLVSWAVPKGPSFDPKQKRMAIHVEDHPVSYGSFEGTIPPKQYGAGKVIVWDRGTWEPVGDPRDGLKKGKLAFQLHGEKLAGLWELIRTAKPDDKQERWFLFKKRDAWARPISDYDVTQALPDSVIGKPLGRAKTREPMAEPASPPQHAASRSLRRPRRPGCRSRSSRSWPRWCPAPPSDGRWIAENKFDGYRLLARIDDGKVRLITRNGNDWTDKMPTLAAAVAQLGLERAWLDGEIVVLNDKGVPDFNALQNALDARRSQADRLLRVRRAVSGRARPASGAAGVAPRGAGAACSMASSNERVRFSTTIDAPIPKLLDAACAMNLEGIIVKRADAPYVSERSDTWLKLKCLQRQEFVIVGFTDRRTLQQEVGGLLLGYHDHGQLRYAGSVGTGWSSSTGRELHDQTHAAADRQAGVGCRPRSNPVAGRAAPRAARSGSSRSWWLRWPSPSGHPMAMCATRRSRACAATSRPTAISREKPTGPPAPQKPASTVIASTRSRSRMATA